MTTIENLDAQRDSLEMLDIGYCKIPNFKFVSFSFNDSYHQFIELMLIVFFLLSPLRLTVDVTLNTFSDFVFKNIYKSRVVDCGR